MYLPALALYYPTPTCACASTWNRKGGDEDETKNDNQKKWRFSLADYSIIDPFHLAKYYDTYLM